VYLFRGPRDEPLYVGTSTDLRSRVRSYFTSGEQRSRITEMVALAQRVDAIPCAHALEAAVRELRLIAEHKPRYNRRSRFPERALWVRLTEEPFPRLSVVRRVRPGAGVFLGPFPDRRAADSAVAAVHEALPLRQCTSRIPARPTSGSACALAGMGRCGAPCTGAQSVDDYAPVAGVFSAAVAGDPGALVAPLLSRVERLAAEERYEDAAVLRDRVAVLLRAVRRRQRLESLAAVHELVLARPDGDGGWELSVVRRGRLVAAGVAARGASVRGMLAELLTTAETITDDAATTSVDETELVLRWMEKPGTRLVELDGTLACPAPGTGAFSGFLARADAGRTTRDPFADGRSLGTRARPDRVTAGATAGPRARLASPA
jgi:DNA polymerase-3 subunit epsilon